MTNQYFFKPDVKLTEMIGRSHFTLSAEIIPPRNGAEQNKVLQQIGTLVDAGAEFLAVTKGAGGSLRSGSLPIAQAIKERLGVPCIAHFTCRDMVASDIENQLIDMHYFGIRNILALRGDPPDGQPNWKARDGGYNYAYELIEQIHKLNRGMYLIRPNDPDKVQNQEPTDFCIGAAAYPDFPNEDLRIEYFKRKVEAGAEYGITDMLFDAETYARFIDLCGKHGLSAPVLPGTRLLKSRSQIAKMQARFKVKVPTEVIEALPEEDGPEGLKRGVDLLVNYAERLRKLGAPGIHLFVIGDTQGTADTLRRLAGTPKQVNVTKTPS